ncbi:MAG: hypothetical protein M0R46_16980 [Candidatus Muirbacterium halophilum]|nr:hypothetical protein [Candidatus Muirbacterium halophilum]
MKKETNIDKISFTTSEILADKLSGIRIPNNASNYTFHFFVGDDSTEINISDEIIKIIENIGLIHVGHCVFIIPDVKYVNNFKTFLQERTIEEIEQKNNFVTELRRIGFNHMIEYEYFNDREKYRPVFLSKMTNNQKYSFYIQDDIFCFYLTNGNPSDDIELPTNIINLIEKTGIVEGGEGNFYPKMDDKGRIINFNKDEIIKKLKSVGFIHNFELDE